MTAVIPGAYGTDQCAALFHTPVKTCHRQLFAITGDVGRRTEVVKTGDLSFRGKGYQSGDRPLRCRGGGLHELFPNLQ